MNPNLFAPEVLEFEEKNREELLNLYNFNFVFMGEEITYEEFVFEVFIEMGIFTQKQEEKNVIPVHFLLEAKNRVYTVPQNAV